VSEDKDAISVFEEQLRKVFYISFLLPIFPFMSAYFSFFVLWILLKVSLPLSSLAATSIGLFTFFITHSYRAYMRAKVIAEADKGTDRSGVILEKSLVGDRQKEVVPQALECYYCGAGLEKGLSRCPYCGREN